MEAPTCKICNTKHWSAQPHAGGAAKAKAKALRTVALVALATVAIAPDKAPKPPKVKPKAKPKAKRRG